MPDISMQQRRLEREIRRAMVDAVKADWQQAAAAADASRVATANAKQKPDRKSKIVADSAVREAKYKKRNAMQSSRDLRRLKRTVTKIALRLVVARAKIRVTPRV